MERRLTAILHADIAGFSRLMEVDEATTILRVRSQIRERWTPSLVTHGGRLINTAGDALLVVFGSAFDAVSCAMALQSDATPPDASNEAQGAIRWRVGIHLSDVAFTTSDVFGNGVNLAQRIQSLSEPGGICISRLVWEALSPETRRLFANGGSHSVKNIAQPVHVYRWGTQTTRAADTSAPTRSSRRKAFVLDGYDPDGGVHRLRLLPETLQGLDGGLIVGRQTAGCDLMIAHHSVSRRHARLTMEGDVLFVEDLGSTNGTTVGAIPQAAGRIVPVIAGRQVAFGDVVFEVRIETDAP